MKTQTLAGAPTRRDLMAGAAALAPSLAVAATTARDSLADLDAVATAQAIRRKEISALEAVDAAIRRAEALQPRLNMLVATDFERARERAKAGGQTGPFAGVPFLVKDLDDYVGLPTRHGSRFNLADPPARTQTPFVDVFDQAGLIVIGKSSTPEYGFLPTTEPVAFGPTRNPWNLAHSSGGSSGGAAAATAARIVPFAHASDGGGSIRMPASNCHVFGLKPSRDRMRPAGVLGSDINIGAMHCVSRSVRDSAALFALLEQSGPSAVLPPVGHVTEPSRRRLRIGLLTRTFGGEDADPAVAAIIHKQADLLRRLGHTVVETRWPVDGGFMQDFVMYWAAGAAGLVGAASKALGHPADGNSFEPFTLGLAGLIAKAKPGDLEGATARLKTAISAYDRWMTTQDVVLCPVLRTPPALLGEVGPTVPFDTLVARLISYVGYTPLHNVAGAPAMSIPAGLTASGLPVGAQYAARAGAERTLYELAYELEQASPWIGTSPPIRA